MKHAFTLLAVTMFSASVFAAENNNVPRNSQQVPLRQISPPAPPAPPGHIAPVTGTPPTMRQTTRMLPAVQLFPAGSDTLSGPSTSLKALATRLHSIAPPRTVIITGYTDDQGSVTDNTLLSLRRARKVQQYLAEKAPQHRYIVTGKGDDNPVADNRYPEGREKNNRVTASLQMDRV